MFKLQFNSLNRDGVEKREDGVIGHDRFCQQKHFSVPRYKRKRTNRRTQEETELAFELIQVPPESDASSICTTTGSTLHRSRSTLHCTSRKPPSQHQAYTRENSFYSTKGSIQQQPNAKEDTGTSENEKQASSSWDTITRYFSTLAATLSCRDTTKNTIKYSETKNGDYNRLGTQGEGSSSGMLNDPYNYYSEKFSPLHKVIQMEKGNAHTLCMNYLELMSGRYVLVDNLPEIGWRPNRLWYLIHDTQFNAERLLTVTSYNGKSQLYNNSISTTTEELKEICQALQHPYVSPILDLEILGDDHFGRQFIVTVTATSDGSLRDLYHRCRWTEAWQNKYTGKGFGVSEVQVQRLSCHILTALLQLRLRGLPSGIGVHFHPGNILIQYGIARFSAIDNILFGHPTSNYLLIKESLSISSPEIIDSIAFAHLLFSMCSGYDLSTIKLSPKNWNDIQDYSQVIEVLEFILEKPEGTPFPSLNEIANHEFYRNLDLRELRALPAPEILSGPPLTALNVFVENLETKRLQKGRKCWSSVGMEVNSTTNSKTHEKRTYSSSATSSSSTLQRPHSTSTPSISKACEEDSKIPSPASLNPNDSNSSEVSLYWTPPNSLIGFLTNESKVD